MAFFLQAISHQIYYLYLLNCKTLIVLHVHQMLSRSSNQDTPVTHSDLLLSIRPVKLDVF